MLNPLNLAIGLLLVWLISKVVRFYVRRRRLTEKFDALPGPTVHPLHPILDIVYMVLINGLAIKKQVNSFVLVYEIALTQCKLFEQAGLFKWYLGFKPVVITFEPETIEAIVTSTNVINKADEYSVFKPWLGEGLVTSKRGKWQFRRKILTPAFHFRILNDFLPTMNEEATKLVRKLNHIKYAESFDVMQVIALCTLDTICETAMGVNMNSQTNENSDYVKALHEVGQMALARVIQPWLWPNFVFYRTETGKRFSEASKRMHEFTREVILARKKEWERMLEISQNDDLTDQEGSSSKVSQMTFDDFVTSSNFKKATKRLAFLDLLMHQHLIENNMTLEDIREEVDTFMFAGHDTTAMNISWTLYLLGLHENVQERVRREVDTILDGQQADEAERLHDDAQTRLNGLLKTSDLTPEHLTQMKYLEMVIKESLRLFPSIPFVARQMTEDVTVKGGKYLIPRGSTCMIFIHALHNNASIYPKPEVFDPNRFLPENVNSRHSFAYIPFSAGPRNCIGQKFALMEVKVILAKVVRNYYVKTTAHRDKLNLVGELVLRSTNGLHMKLEPRFRE